MVGRKIQQRLRVGAALGVGRRHWRFAHDADERRLIAHLIEGLQAIPGVRIYGITDPKRFGERCSTLSLRIGNHHPRFIAEFLGKRGIFTWDGNYYALNLTERLQMEQKGGMLRIGLVHYNTLEEVDRLLGTLREFASQ